MIKIFLLLVYYTLAIHLPSGSFGSLGVRFRSFVCKKIFCYCGTNINIASGVRFGRGGRISIGDNSGLGERSFIVGMDDVVIGRDVMMGPEVMILTGGHGYSDPDVRLIDQDVNTAPVIICDDVWIGARSLILPGVTIGSRSIVGAGSVVTRNVPPNTVVAGNPARIINSVPK